MGCIAVPVFRACAFSQQDMDLSPVARCFAASLLLFALFLAAWLIVGIAWLAHVSAASCPAALLGVTVASIVLELVLPLLIAVSCCCPQRS